MKRPAVSLVADGRWHVYVIVDGLGNVFYVGMTNNLLRRAGNHLDADGHVKAEILARSYPRGVPVQMISIADYATKAEAAWRELAEIARHPGLVNRTGRGEQAHAARRELARINLAPIAAVLGRRNRRGSRKVPLSEFTAIGDLSANP